MKRMSKTIFLWVFVSSLALDIFAFLMLCIFSTKALDVTSVVVFWTLAAVLSVVLSAVCSKILSSKIAKPINNIDLSLKSTEEIYKELTPFTNNLNSQLRQTQKQLERAKREHKMQDKIRQEFTANVSHELKTPLTTISGYAEIMKNGMVRDEDVTRFSEKIYTEAQRLIALVGDIIRLSRLDENAVEEKKERIELYALCENIISRLESAAAKQNVKLELVGGKAEIFGIVRIIDEMIYNLCDNAIKYNKENGTVTVSVKQTLSEVVLSVTDTGIGIAKEDSNRVFERFFRVNKSRSKEIGGTGLGLSIVKHGAAVHDAQLSIESEIDKGTTFKVVFKA